MTPIPRRLALALAGLSLLLVACADASRIYNTQVETSYRPYKYGYGAAWKDLRTEIHGSAFGMDGAQFEDAFLTALNRHQPLLPPTHFTTEPGDDSNPAYKAVFMLNAPMLNPYRVCREPLEVPQEDLGETVRVTAAFCQGQGLLTMVSGEVDGVSGIDDPKLDRMLGQMIIVLFPPKDPNEDRGPRFLVTGAGGVLSSLPAASVGA